MSNRFASYAATCLLFLFFSACSTQKNTWGSRHFHEITTKYNVYFNGHESYKTGIKQLESSHQEDFSRLLPLFAVSNHEHAKATASSMNRSIEKCQKAIKKHSIRVKPEKKPNSKSSEVEKLFYSKEEFNPFMDRVFLLMANSEFHKADFLSASATCSYIIRHFSTNKITCDKAGILLARAYTELEWYYDAENCFSQLNKEHLTPSLSGNFSSAYADFLIRQKKYAEAIPYMEIAVKKAKSKSEKHRWLFLLAQLYQETGKANQAYKLYCTIPGTNPTYAMELNARVRQTEVYPDINPQKPLRALERLSKSSKNGDFLDQIYYAMGNLYFAAKDTLKAVRSFQFALEKSAQNGSYKLKTQLALGAYYYRTEQFIQAEPLYTNAVSQLKKEDERFANTFQRAEILKTLAPELKTIHEEDSLQILAKMPEKERNQVVTKRIEAAKNAAKEAARQKSISEALKNNGEQLDENTALRTRPENINPDISTPEKDNSWYFYNPTTMGKGLTEFRRKWGKRSLKDDWRRNNKTEPFENTPNPDKTNQTPDKIKVKDSAKEVKLDTTAMLDLNFSEGAENPLSANFYLKDLPFTEEQQETSNGKIADALYNAGLIYREQMENNNLALKTFKELEIRFPKSPLLEKAYYTSYLMLKQQKRNAEAEIDRQKQLTLFPEGILAQRLKDSLFIEKLSEMYRVQDTLYAKTYEFYLGHQTDSLTEMVDLVEKNYPTSTLLPHFAFLQAMESAKTGQSEVFHQQLINITNAYPKSNLIPTIHKMLTFWDQGRRPVPSSGFENSLQTFPDVKVDSVARLDSLSKQFQYDPTQSHVLLIAYPANTNANRLQFDVALYNFTNFLIRDYDVSIAKVGQMDVLLVRGFENAEDVMRYNSWLVFQNTKPEEKYPGIKFIISSESNLKLLEEGVPVEKYIDFFNKKYLGSKPKP